MNDNQGSVFWGLFFLLKSRGVFRLLIFLTNSGFLGAKFWCEINLCGFIGALEHGIRILKPPGNIHVARILGKLPRIDK